VRVFARRAPPPGAGGAPPRGWGGVGVGARGGGPPRRAAPGLCIGCELYLLGQRFRAKAQGRDDAPVGTDGAGGEVA
jgi:hypothetical protein